MIALAEVCTIPMLRVLGRPFVKRLALCYQTVVCLSVTLVYCGQTVRWIKMPFGMEIGRNPGDFVRWGPSPSSHPPIFGPCLLWPNGRMDQYATWYAGRPRPKRHCVKWEPAPPKKAQPPIFGQCSLWSNGWMD